MVCHFRINFKILLLLLQLHELYGNFSASENERIIFQELHQHLIDQKEEFIGNFRNYSKSSQFDVVDSSSDTLQTSTLKPPHGGQMENRNRPREEQLAEAFIIVIGFVTAVVFCSYCLRCTNLIYGKIRGKYNGSTAQPATQFQNNERNSRGTTNIVAVMPGHIFIQPTGILPPGNTHRNGQTQTVTEDPTSYPDSGWRPETPPPPYPGNVS